MYYSSSDCLMVREEVFGSVPHLEAVEENVSSGQVLSRCCDYI